jgi:Phage integrase, N-terminal SAM-like domain
MSTESNRSGQQSDSEIGRPRLLQRVHEAIRVRHYSRRTEEAYVHWIKRLGELERKVGTHDRAIGQILDAIRQLTQPPEAPKRRRIGFL